LKLSDLALRRGLGGLLDIEEVSERTALECGLGIAVTVLLHWTAFDLTGEPYRRHSYRSSLRFVRVVSMVSFWPS